MNGPRPVTEADPGATPAPPARRASETERRILEAAREILAERGVPHLTIEAVAARSGVAKTTIYRRWRAKDELALAVVIDMVERVVQTPDLGDTRAELIAFLDATVREFRTSLMGRVMQGIVSHLAADPQLRRAFTEKVVRMRLAEVVRLVEAGVRRGDIRSDIDPELVHELLLGPVYHRLLLTGRPLDKGLAARIVDAVLAGIAAPSRRAD